jgi:alpha-tubulin suppressor-like RCC1 family protein
MMDGTVYAWGKGAEGQLGNNGTSDASAPVRVLGGVQGTTYLSNVDKVVSSDQYSVGLVVAGDKHSAALTRDGEVYCWGSQAVGAGGTSTTKYTTPNKVGGLLAGKIVTQIASGSDFMLARTSDGRVYAWGVNDRGQLGDGSTSYRSAPVEVMGGGQSSVSGFLENILTISAGRKHGYALDSTGKVFTWGDNTKGQLGANLDTPYETLPVKTVSKVAVELAKTNRKTFAPSSHIHVFVNDPVNQKVYAWGDGTYGKLGNGSTTNVSSASPVTLTYASAFDGKQVLKLSAGGFTSAAVVLSPTGERELYTWGRKDYGSLGYPVATSWQSTPKQVTDVIITNNGGVVDVACGALATHVVKTDGAVYGIGYNGLGHVGNGSTTDVSIWTNIGLSDIVRVESSSYSTVALTNNGELYAWGQHFTHTPVKQSQFTNVTEISGAYTGSGTVASGGHLVIISNGMVYTIGNNYRGQLGVDTNINTTTPVTTWQHVELGGLRAVKVVCGENVTVVVMEDGTLRTFGDNTDNMLTGFPIDGNPAYTHVPQKPPVQNVFDVGCLTSEKNIYYLQMDDPTKVQYLRLSRTPLTSTAIAGTSPSFPYQNVSNSYNAHVLVIEPAGTVLAWGIGNSGCLGQGNTSQYSYPVRVKGPGGSGYLTDVVAVATGGDI